MLTATLVVLAVLLVAAALLLVVAVLQRRTARRLAHPAAAAEPARERPALGTPAQVWLERGEKVAERLRRLGTEHPELAGAGDDAGSVLVELRAAAAEVAALDAARTRLPVTALRSERRRLDDAIATAGDGPSAADLRSARDAVAARLALAERHRAATDALLARMRAAVAGMEQAEAELTGLLAVPSEAAAAASKQATADLADRLAGLRAGLAEVRAITARASGAAPTPDGVRDQGQPGDVPGSVEPPPIT